MNFLSFNLLNVFLIHSFVDEFVCTYRTYKRLEQTNKQIKMSFYMKKLFSFIAILSLLLTGCEGLDSDGQNGNNGGMAATDLFKSSELALSQKSALTLLVLGIFANDQ